MFNYGAIIDTAAKSVGKVGEGIANSKALDQQRKYTKQGQTILNDSIDSTKDEYGQTLSPYTDMAEGALQDYQGLDTQQANYNEFDQDDWKDPGYDYRVSQGVEALDQGAASGGLFSGGQQKALLDYGQNAASEEYANSYDRFTDSRDFDTELDAANYERAEGKASYLNDMGSDATNTLASTNMELENARTQGLLDYNDKLGNIAAGKRSNFGNTWNDFNGIAGDGAQSFFGGASVGGS